MCRYLTTNELIYDLLNTLYNILNFLLPSLPVSDCDEIVEKIIENCRKKVWFQKQYISNHEWFIFRQINIYILKEYYVFNFEKWGVSVKS